MSACLVIQVFLVFGRTVQNGFVNFDDDTYVYENRMVSQGLSQEGVVWAFTCVHSSNWHPLTWLSHMLDCQIFGMWAGGHHMTSLLLHATAVVLLFLALHQMTGALWRCAFVSSLWAIHPLRVESVAWVAERKDVLSGVFFMLTLWAYLQYLRDPESKRRYAMILLWFALGLMSKPMLVTLPFVLLLLDYWPLGRLKNPAQFFRLLREKLPLLVLAALMCLVTVFAQQDTIQTFVRFPLLLRMENAFVASFIYIGKLAFPVNLAVLYPYPQPGWPIWQVVAAILFFTIISSLAYGMRREKPYLSVGWVWYLVMLAPVIGIIQIGHQAYADRYTYLPQIGLLIAGTWAASEWAGGIHFRRVALSALAGVMLCVFSMGAAFHTLIWRDSVSLWLGTLQCTPDNVLPHNNLGIALFQQGSFEDAVLHFREALKINPSYAEAAYNLGNAELHMGHIGEAVASFRKALEIRPTYAEAHGNLGAALFQQGRSEEAVAHLREAIRMRPALAESQCNLGIALQQKGLDDAAIAHFREALKSRPTYAEAHFHLGTLLIQSGQSEEGIAHWRKTIELQPKNAEARLNLAWVLATRPTPSLRESTEAVQLSMEVAKAGGANTVLALRTLAASYAGTGDFPRAVTTAQNAWQIAELRADADLADRLTYEIRLYESGQTFREAP